jgi:hypothetical protein
MADGLARAGVVFVAAAGGLVLSRWLYGQLFVEIRRRESSTLFGDARR